MPDKKKIIYVVPTLGLGGTESQLFLLVVGLKDKFNITVCSLYSLGPIAKKIEEAGAKVVCLNLTSIWDIRFVVRFLKLLLRERFQLIHTFLFDAIIWAVPVAKMAGVPCVISSRRNLDDWMKFHHLILQRLVNCFTSYVTVNSERVRKFVLQKERLPDWKVITIYNGLDIDKFQNRFTEQQIVEKRKELKIEKNEFVICNVASFKISKGHKYLLEALKIVKQRVANNDIKLILVGSGPLQKGLHRKAKRLALGENVLFLGSRNDISEILSIADISVFTSIREGLSSAILESMAMNKPVVATDVGGNAEVILHNENGLIVPPKNLQRIAEAILTLYRDRNARLNMGNKASAYVKNRFKIEDMVEANLNLYKKVFL